MELKFISANDITINLMYKSFKFDHSKNVCENSAPHNRSNFLSMVIFDFLCTISPRKWAQSSFLVPIYICFLLVSFFETIRDSPKNCCIVNKNFQQAYEKINSNIVITICYAI